MKVVTIPEMRVVIEEDVDNYTAIYRAWAQVARFVGSNAIVNTVRELPCLPSHEAGPCTHPNHNPETGMHEYTAVQEM